MEQQLARIEQRVHQLERAILHLLRATPVAIEVNYGRQARKMRADRRKHVFGLVPSKPSRQGQGA